MSVGNFQRCEALIEEHAEKFGTFYALLEEYNKKFNLTSICGREEVYIKHFLDSLAGEERFPRGARVAEVGSGAGFPSIPLMIARDDLTFTLIESTGKKCEFLRAAAKELSLPAEIVCIRAEDAGKDAHYREKFDVCCARAVARLDTLAEYCLPLVRTGGKMIAYKGTDGETGVARGAIRILGGGETRVFSYALPGGRGARTLVEVEKGRRTPPAYPRGMGKERKDPLK